MWGNKVNRQIILKGSLTGGFVSSLVKWGSEVNMPPRMPGEPSPPAMNIDAWLGWTGLNAHSLDYIYQSASVAGAVTLYHWLFSFAFTFVYVAWSAWGPGIRMFRGALYGLIITLVMHGFLIPLLGFRNPVYDKGATGWLWNLNMAELCSEILGHVCWAFSIEICLVAVLAMSGRPVRGPWAEKKSTAAKIRR